MNDHSKKLYDASGYSVWMIGRDRLEELTRFVFSVYYARFDATNWAEAGDDFAHMLDDDIALAPYATIFAAVAPSGRILSTARAIERRDVPLPIERDFGLSIHTLSETFGPRYPVVNRVYEVARLATDVAAICQEGFSRETIPAITESVLGEIIRRTAVDGRNVWVASMDTRALALFRSRGYAFMDVGETNPAYLGSPSTPVALPVEAWRSHLRETQPKRYAALFGQQTQVPAAPPAGEPQHLAQAA